MNVQAQMSGQVSGQVPTQPGTQLPLLSQQNGHPLPHIQNSHPDFQKARSLMQSRICDFLMRRHPNTHEIQPKRLSDIARRLEEGVYRNARSQEEYLNCDTLERRLQVLLSRPAVNNHNQQYPQLVNSSSSIGTMIPTPGLSHGGNSNLTATSSMDASLIASPNSMTTPNINSRSLLTPNVVPSGGTHNGFLSNGYQGGNNMLSSVNVQRITSQMIPTPGFNGNNNNSYMNIDSSNVNNGISGVDSTMLSQQQQQKQHVGGQNSHILHNLGSQLSSGIRSGLSKSYGFSNGAVNNSHGAGSNIQNVNVQQGASEAYMTANAYGDGYGLSSTDVSGPGNFYGSVTSGGSMTNSQNLNLVGLQTVPTMNSPLSTHPSNSHGSQSIDQSEKINFQSSLSLRDNQSQSQQQQFQPQPSMYHQEFVQQHHQQKPQVQQRQHMVKKNALGQSQLASDLGVQVKSEHGMGLPNEILNSQLSEKFQYSQLDNSLRQNSQLQHHFQQNSQQMQQMLHAQQLVGDQQNGATNVSVGVQPEYLMAGQWQSQSQASHFAHEQHVQEEFRQRIVGQDEAQCNNFSSEGPIMSQTVVSKQTIEQPSSNGVSCTVENVNHERDSKNQIRWICFILHAHRCSAPVGKCLEVNCRRGQNLLDHMKKCKVPHCSYPRCRHTQRLFDHFKQCKDLVCPVCVHVKNLQQKAAQSRQPMESVFSGQSSKPFDAEEPLAKLTSKTSPVIGNLCELQPSLKRAKIEHSSQSHIHGSERFMASSLPNSDPHISNVSQCEDYDQKSIFMPTKPQFAELKVEDYMNCRQESPRVSEMKKDNMDDIYNQRPDSHRVLLDESATSIKQEGAKPEKENDIPKEEKVALSVEQSCGTKSGKPMIKGVSLTELFTPEQVKEHIRGLRQWVGQSKAKAEKNQAMEHTMSENSCQLCAVEKLTFEPPPIYCTPCGVRIKRNAMYYTMGSGETRHCFCIPCYNETRGDTILADGNPIQKARLEKKKNDDESEEWWVQCDKCEAWQHQICALFNGRRNDGGQAEYTCPNCYIAEVERGERQPLPQSAVLGAKDLPRTILSDHIEQRLFRKLKQERLDRARSLGKSYDEVPGAEALVVRVVSSVDKRLDVKERFLEIFQEENYPTEFPYKSKVVLLFQKIEGVEVCLFGMYVQEFGSECQFPNQRRVYLSYLDSVKYFRPEIKANTGEALRTFVYHEILIGYLEYCKNRGFTSCYIWACPPLKGEDYILYCHPEIQKTPKSDKLREWYLSMLRKAKKEDIVVDLTNLYDHFFVSNGECKAKVTAARLPYFDGDYWPGAAEDMIYQLCQEEDARKLNKKGTTKKAITKRALKASGQTDLSTNTSKDWLLMHKLGETISPMKEDFIMVHLQHACSHCCLLMVCGNRWVCNQCRNFELCDRCYEAEQKREEREKHPVHLRDKHTLYPVEIMDVPVDTKDKDEILESEFFDTRQAFLSLCQGNHYQYDTLRRAKHSSMMVLYHLHNPTAPAFVITCNICHLDIEAGQGWRCEVCPDYDVCNACYKKNGGIDHPHKLTNHPSLAERDAQNKEARQLRVLQLRKMLDLLIHASQCRSAHCQYPHCRKVKGLFRHGMQCKIRAGGGCVLCKKMWYLLQLHARACKESECNVPRCRDLKEHMRRLQQQSDSRRRAAVMEMMRQRAAEVAGIAG